MQSLCLAYFRTGNSERERGRERASPWSTCLYAHSQSPYASLGSRSPECLSSEHSAPPPLAWAISQPLRLEGCRRDQSLAKGSFVIVRNKPRAASFLLLRHKHAYSLPKATKTNCPSRKTKSLGGSSVVKVLRSRQQNEKPRVDVRIVISALHRSLMPLPCIHFVQQIAYHHHGRVRSHPIVKGEVDSLMGPDVYGFGTRMSQ